jgi:CheY-like chemotaxis protein
MVHGLAAQLGGAFALTSAPAEGTRADLYLPVAQGKATGAIPAHHRALPMIDRPLAILLIDDEEIVRTATAEMIRDLGHDVIEAAGGAEALGKLAAGLRVDAVITDYKMPRINGAELSRRVNAIRPGVPILIITGYTGTTEDILKLPRLAKPFTQGDIALALAELIDAGDNVVPLRRG